MPTPDIFSAMITVDGASIQISAPTLSAVAALLAKIKSDAPATLVGSTLVPAPATPAASKTTAKADVAPGKSQSAAPAEKPSAASATDAAGVTYEDVKRAVNALYAIDPKHAVAALAAFDVKNGKGLDPKQWDDFCAYAKGMLDDMKEGAPA